MRRGPLEYAAQNDLGSVTQQIAYCNAAKIALAGWEEINKAEAKQRPWLFHVRCLELSRRGDLAGATEAAEHQRKAAETDAYGALRVGLLLRYLCLHD